MKNEQNKNKNTSIGAAGAYYVMGELLRQGILAALSPRNAFAYNILATDLDTDETVKIRVQTKTKPLYQWNAKGNAVDDTIFQYVNEEQQKQTDDFCVLVNLEDDAPIFYVFYTWEVDDMLKGWYKRWLDTPGTEGQPHNPNPLRFLHIEDFPDEFAKHKNAWGLLWE